ncbi:MAG: hypothetical protein FJ149_06970, partial [Euryarchaeota archaeon]|nr:hypothetical protein [Euryarchaeota archaeon]
MRRTKRLALGAVLLTLVIVMPTFSAFAGKERAVPDIVIHVSTFTDGSTSKVLDFQQGGTDDSVSVRLPNGAVVLSAKLNVTGLPLVEGGTDYPYNVTLDLNGAPPAEWQFKGKGYGQMGRQTVFTNGATNVNLSLPLKGGTNSTGAIRLPLGATVTSAKMNITNLRGGGGGGRIAIECAQNSRARDTQGNDPVYSIQALAQAYGWEADIVVGTDIDTQEELAKYAMVIAGDAGFNDDDHSTFDKALDTWVQNGGGFVGLGWIVYSTTAGTGMNSVLPVVTPGYSYDSSGTITITDKNHELTVGVNDFSVQQYCEYPSNGIKNGASSVANAPSGRPCVAWWNLGAGRSVYIGPVSFGCFQNYPNTKNYYSDANFQNLLLNAIAFTAGQRTLNCSVDILNDGSAEWKDEALNGSQRLPDFTGLLNGYLATARPTGTDAYGNRYVDVPIAVSSNTSGYVSLANMTIQYQYTATVEENPQSDTLAEAFNELLPSSYNGQWSEIKLYVGSERAGRVRLSDLSLDFRPPIHLPSIDSREPGSDVVVMNENETQVFSVAASDEFGYPLEPVWYLDTLESSRGDFNFTFSAGYDSAGDHSLRVVVNNTMRSAATSWKIQVLNVNRPPAIDTFYPDDEVTIDEEGALTLGVAASDPDPEDRELSYTWYVGSVDQKITGDSFRFSTDLKSAGVHSIRVKVTDPGGLSVSRTWRVTVLNVNVPPVVDSLQPNANPRVRETEHVSFSISASDFDKQTLIYRWYLDGTEVGTGQQYTYKTGYDSAGMHLVEVVITDGEANVSRSWTVTVEDVNRMPVPVIDSPVGKLDFLETEEVSFSALSSSDPDGDTLKYRWLEGSRELSQSREFSARFPRGPHEVTLEVTDQNRATNKTSVRFNVHYIKLVANIGYDILAPVEGQRVTFTAWVNNTGDAEATGIEVELLVDGTSLGRKPVDDVPGGGTGSATFEWKAKKGEHVVTARIGGQSWN